MSDCSIRVITKGGDYSYEIQGVVKLFFPGRKVSEYAGEIPQENFVIASCEPTAEGSVLRVSVDALGRRQERSDNVFHSEQQRDSVCERGLSAMLYRILSEITGIAPKWGILTGIRPVKLIERRIEAGRTPESIRREFKEEFLVSDEKLNLAFATQEREHAVLARSTPDSYSLYISIPFCPSRCLYCSFVSHSIEKTYKLMDQYIDCLCEEIEQTARLAEDCGLKLRTVYFGGGTPTSITAQQLRRITDCVAANFDLSDLWEYTIEAGRPDTVTREKLEVIRDAGVTRVSINPQTLNDEVLAFVGRKHSAQEFVDCFNLAREVGLGNINTDVIAGLPTDTLDSFKNTIDCLLKLAPENITVHTLSVKRSAQLAQSPEESILQQTQDVSAMVDYSQQKLIQGGYGPYYLYRQRDILDNLENTGYCLPGREGLYNVYIMDETHTVLACGAGAVSKLRQPVGDDIQRVFNFKYPYEYISRFEEMLARKEQVREFYRRYPALEI